MRLADVVMPFIPLSLLLATSVRLIAAVADPVPLIGTDALGISHHPPVGWPNAAGAWNGKAARLCPATRKLVFETFRQDVVGGSFTPAAGTITAAGVTTYYVAGPGTGSTSATGTTVLYTCDSDGANPLGIGIQDVVDGVGGVAIYEAAPSPTGTPNALVRRAGATVYANQNKDLAAWTPDGAWIICGIEMPVHALTHDAGNSETGNFNNLWAISADAKTWVQLTHYENTWAYYDPVAIIPYAALQSPGDQYSTPGTNEVPFKAYFGSAAGTAPPASGTFRPIVGNRLVGGRVPLVVGERVGNSAPNTYTWGGPFLLALADVVFIGGLPALANYRRALAPTPSNPSGIGGWANPGGNAVIGAGYEPWGFSADDAEILFASDVFLQSTSLTTAVRQKLPGYSDVVAWAWQSPQALTNLTARTANYAYVPNGVNTYGYWEEPAVYATINGAPFVALGSSADLSAFGLDLWLAPRDLATATRRITTLNRSGSGQWLAYPTAFDATQRTLYLSIVPLLAFTNPPGLISTWTFPTLTSPVSATGTAGQPFTYVITASSPLSGFAASGLPPGLTLSALGVVSGTPTTAGTYAVVLTATGMPGAVTTTMTIAAPGGSDPPSSGGGGAGGGCGLGGGMAALTLMGASFWLRRRGFDG